MRALDGFYIGTICRLNRLKEKILYDENGDTNLISIIMVLGIVLALVVIFRNQLGTIVSKVSGQVKDFSTDVKGWN